VKSRIASIVVLALALTTATAFAQSGQAQVRAVHASPDAPAVDILVNDGRAFANAPFKGITNYASLDAGTYNVKVVPADATEPVVIEADLPLQAGMNYTVVAAGRLADIEPVVLMNDSGAPAAGKAHVRFAHFSPDAPAVDIAVKDGPVVFSNVAFKDSSSYTPVDAGSYDLEVRLAGTSTVALSVPGVALQDGTVYTIYAMGLAGGSPALEAVVSEDATMARPAALPTTGEGSSSSSATTLAIAAGVAMVAGALMLRRRTAQETS
jgi:LPXTG-motif cell wall-anchored protein